MAYDWSRRQKEQAEEDEAEGFSVKWDKPKEIQGKVTQITDESFGKDNYTVILIDVGSGTERKVKVTPKVLRRKILENPPQVGDGIHIIYTGEAASSAPGMNATKLFDVTVIPGGLVGERSRSDSRPAAEDGDEPF